MGKITRWEEWEQASSGTKVGVILDALSSFLDGIREEVMDRVHPDAGVVCRCCDSIDEICRLLREGGFWHD